MSSSTVRVFRALAVAPLLALGACGGAGPSTPTAPAPPPTTVTTTPPPSPGPPPPTPVPDATLVGAGDIVKCTAPEAELTARLLDRIAGTVVSLGDNVYPNSTAEL